MARLALFLSATLALAACSTTSGSLGSMFSDGRKSYVQENGLTGKDSVHVMEGRIYRGMPVEHALASLGPSNSQDTTTTPDGRTRIEYMYQSRGNAFDPGNLPRAYVYAIDEKVTDWKNLDQIPRFKAYYEGGM